MRIRTKYKTNVNGREQIVARTGERQLTHNYDHALSMAANHGDAAGELILAKYPELVEGFTLGLPKHNESLTEFVFEV